MSEKQTFKQINDQESSAYMNGSGDYPTVLISRTKREGEESGRVTVARLNKDTREAHFTEDGQKWTKTIALENLSDQRQGELAEELAGRALRGAVEMDANESVPKSTVEFDDDGLIKMPEWMKSSDHDQAVASLSMDAADAEPVHDPLDDLSDDVRGEVLQYRRTLQNKVESERAKDFAQAAEDGRAIYRFQQTLSPAAKAFLNLR